ncbi:redoxin domain-containing protein [Pseudodesulfovibrio cashew]|nr:redoxin domain-containing protein [Pseudodesulfovibrio cashew]
MGYTNVYRYPRGFHGWKASHPELVSGDEGKRKVLAVGDLFPDCRVAVLSGDRDREYLGLPSGARWLSLADLKAKFVLIQMYNTMCNDCVSETKKLSQFAERVESDPVLAGKLKFIGLGVFDTNRDVVRFRKHYDVSYPLFSDSHGQIFECLGQAQLPLAYLVRSQGDGNWIIELVKRGYFEPDDHFLETLRMAVTDSKATP